MARKPSTKRRSEENKPNESLEQFFSAKPAQEEVRTGEKDEGKKQEPTTADLLARIEQLNTRVESAERDRAVLMSQTTPHTPTAPQPPKLSFDGLPDPAYEADKYQKAMAERTAKYVEDLRAYEKTTAEQADNVTSGRQQRSQQLWDDFKKDYEDYAADEDRVQFAAQKVARRLQGRGVDVEKYMFANSDQYMKDVASEMDTIFGKDTLDVNLDRKTDGDDEAIRTAGIPGGVGARGVATTTSDPGGDFTKEIQDVQRKMGIF